MPDTDATQPASTVQLSREQILKATSACLQDVGYDATTIRQIAGRLDCAVGSIYRYFKDKRELLSAVTQQTLEPVAAMAESGQPLESTSQLYYRIAVHSPETYRLMFWLACEPGAATRLPPVVARIVDAWARSLKRPSIAFTYWSLLHGCVLTGRPFEEVTWLLPKATEESPSTAAVVTPPPTAAPVTSEPKIVVTMTEPPALPQAPPEVSAPAETTRDARAEDVVLL